MGIRKEEKAMAMPKWPENKMAEGKQKFIYMCMH